MPESVIIAMWLDHSLGFSLPWQLQEGDLLFLGSWLSPFSCKFYVPQLDLCLSCSLQSSLGTILLNSLGFHAIEVSFHCIDYSCMSLLELLKDGFVQFHHTLPESTLHLKFIACLFTILFWFEKMCTASGVWVYTTMFLTPFPVSWHGFRLPSPSPSACHLCALSQ